MLARKQSINAEDLYRFEQITDCQLSPDSRHLIYHKGGVVADGFRAVDVVHVAVNLDDAELAGFQRAAQLLEGACELARDAPVGFLRLADFDELVNDRFLALGFFSLEGDGFLDLRVEDVAEKQNQQEHQSVENHSFFHSVCFAQG